MAMFLRPLDDVLSTTSKVRLLRILSPLSAPLSGREAARLAGVAQPAAMRALDDLVRAGLVARDHVGIHHAYRANSGNVLSGALAALFEAEEARAQGVIDWLRELMYTDGDRVRSMVVVGSAARGQDRPGSDLDLLVVVRSRRWVSWAHDRLTEAAEEAQERFGLELSPIVLTVRGFVAAVRDEDPFAKGALAEHRYLMGELLEHLVRFEGVFADEEE